MIKKILAALLFLFAAAAFAAVDANTASQAELEAIKGIGPALSGRIIEERQKAPFKDWQDLATRVKGVGVRNSSKFSSAGLTVNGAAYTPPPPRASKPQSDAPEQAPKPSLTGSKAKPGQLQSAAPAGAEKQAAKSAAAAGSQPSSSKASADEPQSSAPVTAPAAKAMTADERKAAGAVTGAEAV
ncbi:MAG TPA: helix-hairpin-helix domain-containing protein, partial [Burkholderiaceae bacterium]